MKSALRHLCGNLWFKYRIAGKFGGGKVWRTALLKVVGEKKFGELHLAALSRLLLAMSRS